MEAYKFAQIHPSVHMKILCAQLLLHLKRDYDQTFTGGRPYCVVVLEAKHFILGQFLLNFGPRLVFTIYTYSGTSFAWNSPYTS